MTPSEFPLEAYLARIRYAGSLAASEDVLDALQRAQLASIPFENFDILLGRKISLDPEAIVAKLIRSPRGGYCFELNGLLLMALQQLGFVVRPLLARVHLSGQASAHTHELLLVELGGRHWIADAGFGGPSLRGPIPLELDSQRRQLGEIYRLVDAAPFGTMLQKQQADGWLNLYSFELNHVIAADVELGNHFTSTHPRSHFTFSRLAAIHTPTGRTALRDLTLHRVEDGTEHVAELVDGPPFIDALSTHFGIELDASYDALRPLPVSVDV